MSRIDPKLYIVATPIGNLEDITLRALRLLKEVDLIAAEDTRRTKKLLMHYEINTPLISYHEYSQKKRSIYIIEQLKEGKAIALVSDAGTPCLSDPGVGIIREALKEGLSVESIPGVSALTGTLSICGLAVDHFVFEGFLDGRRARRRHRLEQLKDEARTLVFFESPYRIMACLEDIQVIFGSRSICLARELTKKFEEVLRGEIMAVLEILRKRSSLKGEITLIVSGKPKS